MGTRTKQAYGKATDIQGEEAQKKEGEWSVGGIPVANTVIPERCHTHPMSRF